MDFSTRAKQQMENRAKQFMPFAALKGFNEALREKEKQCISRHGPSEEAVIRLNAQLTALSAGQTVQVVFDHGDAYKTLTGVVACVDGERSRLYVGDTAVLFSEIRELAVVATIK